MFGRVPARWLRALTDTTDSFQQVSLEVAETYEAAFVPTLFAGLAPHLIDAAGVTEGERVLDVACGTASSRA